MSAVVVNRIVLTVPVEQLLPDLEREFPPVLHSLPGFQRFEVVQVGPSEVVVLIHWDTVEHATTGGAVIGPGAFHQFVAPHTLSQDRVVGVAVVDATA